MRRRRGTGGLSAAGRELELGLSVPNRSLQADLVSPDRVDCLLEPGQVDQRKVIDGLTDDCLNTHDQRRWAIHTRLASLESFGQLVLATGAAHIIYQQVSRKGEQRGS